MGNEISRTQYLTLGAFLVNVGTQTYGMLTSPNMKDVADANHYAFSPSPWFIAAFFSGQTLLQAYWIRQLFRLNPAGYQPISNTAAKTAGDELQKQAADDAAIRVATDYAPIYALGNVCIAGWLLFWLKENFIASQVLVTINTAAHLFAIARLPPLTANSSPLLYTTHFVAKSIAGIGILDFVDNGGVAWRVRAPPSGNIQTLTYLLFPIAAAMSGPFFGSTLLFDLLGIYVGQRGVTGAGAWSSRVGWASVATAAIVGIKGFLSLQQA